MKPSISTRGRPAVPETRIVTVLTALVAQVFDHTTWRARADAARKSMVATHLPLTDTVAKPLPGDRGVTQAIERPVKVMLADAPARVA